MGLLIHLSVMILFVLVPESMLHIFNYVVLALHFTCLTLNVCSYLEACAFFFTWLAQSAACYSNLKGSKLKPKIPTGFKSLTTTGWMSRQERTAHTVYYSDSISLYAVKWWNKTLNDWLTSDVLCFWTHDEPSLEVYDVRKAKKYHRKSEYWTAILVESQ